MNTLKSRVIARSQTRITTMVPLPWGEGGSMIDVPVRSLNAAEMEALETAAHEKHKAKVDPKSHRVPLVIATVEDGNGELLFTDADADMLASMPGGEITKLFDAAYWDD